MASPNQHLLEPLGKIAEVYRSQGVIHKYHAYRTAMDTIKQVDHKIASADELKGLKGIGKAMLEKVHELLTTGELQQEHDVTSDPINAALQLFTSVHGVGPVLAKKLVHELNLRTLDDLRRTTYPLPAQVRLGLKYHEQASQRIPFAEFEEHMTFVTAFAKKLDRKLVTMCCGSHRRGALTSGDIDLLVTHPVSRSDSGATYLYLPTLVKMMQRGGYIVDVLADGPCKFMGYCRLPGDTQIVRRLDMRWFPYDSFFPALLYFTGSDMFNVSMRVEALKKGYTINEYGVFATTGEGSHEKGKKIPVFSEEDIFAVVGMKYLEPHQRNHQ